MGVANWYSGTNHPGAKPYDLYFFQASSREVQIKANDPAALAWLKCVTEKLPVSWFTSNVVLVDLANVDPRVMSSLKDLAVAIGFTVGQ